MNGRKQALTSVVHSPEKKKIEERFKVIDEGSEGKKVVAFEEQEGGRAVGGTVEA